MDFNFLALMLIAVIGVVCLFAQLQLFAISKTLREILLELRHEQGATDDEVSLSILRR